MRFHWQDLNDGPHPRKNWLNGRAWWGPFRLQWVFKNASYGFTVELDAHDPEINSFFGCGLFALYFGCALPKWIRPNLGYRETDAGAFGVRFFDGAAWFDVWTHPFEWNRQMPFWRVTHRFSPIDALLGRRRHVSWETVEERDVLIPMPEGSYPAHAKIEVGTWKRARWFAMRRTSAKVDILLPGGIPFQGKGENSWDCGEDGLCWMGTPAKTIEEAIGDVVGSVLQSRKRYGEPDGRMAPVLSPRVQRIAS